MKKETKIMIITNHSGYLYQFRRELLEKLSEKHQILLVMPFQGHVDDFCERGYHCIETEVDRRGLNPLTDLKLLKVYNKIISEQRPDKVITYSIKPNIYGGIICRQKKIPYYANVQGLGTAFQKKWLARFVSVLYRVALKRVQKVFFENEFNAKAFTDRKIISQAKTSILKGAGVNLDYYRYQPYPSEATFHFLFLGRIMKEKGVDELFAAMTRLQQEYEKKVILDIGGFFEEEYKEKVRVLAEKGVIRYHGFIKDTRPYYARANCIVLPSYHEGMSNVLLEAAATGRPVITSDIPGCREAVEDGKTGYLCEVKNAEILFEKMKLMADKSAEEIEEMGRCARKRMEELFDKRKIVEQTVEIISGK